MDSCAGTPTTLGAKAFQAAFDAILDYVIIVDKNLVIHFLNRVFEKKNVVESIHEALEEPLYKVFSYFLNEPKFQHALQDAREKKTTQYIEELEHQRRQDGKLKYYKTNVAPILHAGTVEGFVLVFESLTPLVQQREFTRILVDGMTHYINNVANNLQSYVRAFESSRDEKYLSYISIASMRISRWIDAMFTLRSVEQGSLQEVEEINLKDIANDILKPLEALNESVAVHLDFSDKLSFPIVPSHLRMVLQVVFQNACEAMETGGRIQVTSWKVKNHVTIDVRNTGPPIPDEVLEKLNRGEPFTSTKAKSGEGVGIGLFIARHIVESIWRGRLCLVNLEGGGVSVFIELQCPSLTEA